MTRWGYIAFGLSIVGLAVAAGAQVAFHERMPDRVPTHWNIHGQPDAWTSKDNVFMIYYLLPTVIAGITALGMFVLPWLSPRNFAVESFRRTYDYVFALVAFLFLYLHLVLLKAMILGEGLGESAFIAAFFVFFALIGNVLGKVKRNFWMGIRTPWTLADPQVWDRTHRMGAWSFVVVGVVGAIAVLLGAPPIACFVGLMAGALWPVLYSLFLYKRLERAGQLAVQKSEHESVAV
jgi:immunity protein, SdpI family